MPRKQEKGWLELPLKKLVKAGWNYKLDDEERLGKLVANLKRNGQIENIIVRKLDTGFYEVVNGNHRYDAFLELGYSEAMCFNLGTITDAAARRVAIETNETKFERDNIKLAELINEMTAEEDSEFSLGELEETMPFTGHELQAFSELSNFEWPKDSEDDGGGGGGGEGRTVYDDIVCAKCGHNLGRGKIIDPS